MHAEHKRQLESYINRYNRYGLFYVGSIAALTLALVASYAVSAVTSAPIDRLTGLIVCAMGALIAILPFATPTTVGAFGIRTSRAIVRVLGAIVMIGAFVTLVL